MARIRKRGSRYTAEVRYKGITDSQSFSDKRDAERWAGAVERAIDKDCYTTRSEQKRVEREKAAKQATPSLADLMLSYADTAEHKGKKGKDQEGRRINWWAKRDLANKAADTILPEDMEAHIEDRLDEGLANDTIRAELCLVSVVYKYFRRQHGLVNPLIGIQRPAPGKGRSRRLTAEEEQRILEAADDDPYPHMRAAIEFALGTAMRRSEQCSLVWKHVNFEAETAYLPETKNGDERTVPLFSNSMGAMHRLPRGIGDAKVFAITPERLSDAWVRTCLRAGVTNLRWHDLRHEGTSRLFEETDFRDMEIMSITGHRSMQMLKRYTHLKAGKLAKRLAADRLSKLPDGLKRRARGSALQPVSNLRRKSMSGFCLGSCQSD